MARNKGQRGEREVIAVLQPIVNRVYLKYSFEPPLLKRNLLQTREGGFDIMGLEWMALEVKYQEHENVNGWWRQTCKQAGTDLVGKPLTAISDDELVTIEMIRSGRKVKITGRLMSDQIRIPILFYRSNHEQWRICMISRLFSRRSQFSVMARVGLIEFCAWFEMALNERMKSLSDLYEEQFVAKCQPRI
jgi:hypothetical protein